MNLVLAPLRGVTIRCFRETFAELVAQAGFTEAVTPFISAAPGVNPMRDRELRGELGGDRGIRLTPQFIGKDAAALRECLLRIRDAGFDTADLNCGCPFPMVRNKGRGSGLLRTPGLLDEMLGVGCEVMGPDKFSVKARLGIDSPDELLSLMPILNAHPLRWLAVHARTARQMYSGECDRAAFQRVATAAKMPVLYNGDAALPPEDGDMASGGVMVGRAFVRQLGRRDDSAALLSRYIEASRKELCGDKPVLGRMKELLAYWKGLPRWRRLWPVLKLSRTLGELNAGIACTQA